MHKKEKLTKKEIVQFLKKTSRKYFKTDIYWRDLGKKFESQNSKCLYSYMKIELGVNASIDHIISLKFGGANNITNMCWCDKHINYAKNSMKLEELKKWLKKLKESLQNSPFLN